MLIDNLIFAIFAFLGIAGLFIARDSLTCQKRYRIKVDAEIIKTYKAHHIFGSGLIAKFRYSLGGNTYEAMAEDEYESSFVKKHPIETGYQTQVYVDPKHLKKIRISNRNETFTGTVILIVSIGLLAAAAGGVGHEILTLI